MASYSPPGAHLPYATQGELAANVLSDTPLFPSVLWPAQLRFLAPVVHQAIVPNPVFALLLSCAASRRALRELKNWTWTLARRVAGLRIF